MYELVAVQDLLAQFNFNAFKTIFIFFWSKHSIIF